MRYLFVIGLISMIGVTATAQSSSLFNGPPLAAPSGGFGPPTFDPNGGVPSANPQATPTLNAPPPSAGGFGPEPPVYLQTASWTHQPAPPLRVFRKNDIVTIRVDEITRVLAEGSSETRKQTLYEAVLSDWIRLTNFRLRPDPQGFGDPAVAVDSNNNYRAESEVETRESLAFNIAATVVDIRPNGTLLLEARKAIRVNDNLWETALSGSCRVSDIGPDNTVLSRDLIDLEIKKEDRGHLRDGYRRGWFQRWLDRAGPF